MGATKEGLKGGSDETLPFRPSGWNETGWKETSPPWRWNKYLSNEYITEKQKF